MSATITREVLEGYLECKYKGRLRLAGDAGEPSDFQAMNREDEEAARARARAHLLALYPRSKLCQGAVVTVPDLCQGAELLLDASIADEWVSLRYDGLLRVGGESSLGASHYAPVLIQASPTVRQQTREVLAVMGLVLGAAQGRQPDVGVIVCGSECRRTRVKLTGKVSRRAADTLEALKQLQAGGKPPVLTLNDHCPMCEFRRHCRSEAVEKDDLSLLRVLSEAELRNHRSRGIFTVTQLAYTFHPRRKGKRAKGESEPHHAALQALALRDHKTYILGKTEVPQRPVRVYLDLEGDLHGTGVYLACTLVVKGGVATMHSLWADDALCEEQLLRRLLDVAGEEDLVLFHFGSYERRFLKRMRGAARRKGPVDRLLASAVDVLSLIRSNV
jgi:predicted RecB family nuclease